MNKKGFTLIELLIVIVIIGILAVALVPVILKGPAESRDSARLTAVGDIITAIENQNLNSTAFTAATGCVDDVKFATLLSTFGGTVPADPLGSARYYGGDTPTCPGQYYYVKNPFNATSGAATGTYNYAILANVEQLDAANADCATAIKGKIATPSSTTNSKTWCYARLVE